MYLLTLDEIRYGSLRETSELDDHKAENWRHPYPQEYKLALLDTGTAMTKSELETLANSSTKVLMEAVKVCDLSSITFSLQCYFWVVNFSKLVEWYRWYILK